MLQWAAAQAQSDGLTVATARCSFLEQDFSFAVADQLLTAAGCEAERIELEVTSSEITKEPALLLPAMRTLFTAAAELTTHRPVLLMIDDLHWADGATLRWLAYLVRRWAGLRIGVIATLCHGEPLLDEQVLDELCQSAQRVPLHGLAPDEVAQLLEHELGAHPAPVMTAACTCATGGNPFLLRELTTTLRRDGGGDRRIGDLSSERAVRGLFLRLRRINPHAVSLATAVAVLGDGADLTVAAAVAGLERESAADAVDVLCAQRVLIADPLLSFVHPIIRHSIRAELPLGTGTALRARAAQVLHRRHSPAREVADHAVAAGLTEEPWVGDVLRRAIRSALERKDHVAAIHYLSQQRRLPTGSEEHARLSAELGALEMDRDPPAATEHLRVAVDEAGDLRVRARAAADLALLVFLRTGYDDAAAVLDPVIARLPEVDDSGARTLELRLLALAAQVDHPSAQAVWARWPLVWQAVGQSGGWRADALAAFHAWWSGEGVAGSVELAERALSSEGIPDELEAQPFVWAAIRVLFEMAAHRPCRLFTERATRLADERGWAAFAAQGELALSAIARNEGQLAESLKLARSARARFPPTWRDRLAGVSGIVLAQIEHGDLAGARTELTGAGVIDLPRADLVGTPHVLYARGRLRAAEKDHEQALADHLACLTASTTGGMAGLEVSCSSWGAWSALALDHHDQARHLAAHALTCARRLANPALLGVALIATALVLDGHPSSRRDEAIEACSEAIALLPAFPLLSAMALTVRGSILSRANRTPEGVADLRWAFDTALRSQASLIVDSARKHLVRAGLRPSRALTGPAALTRQERSVAQLAIEGNTNQQIATQLFLTLRTVEHHLTTCYRKLGISGRRELKAVLADG